MATIQFRLAFKDKGHKSLEHCCLVIHLTISNAESNGGIFILIGPLGIYKYTMKRTASDLSTNTISLDFQFKGHKSLEYWCLMHQSIPAATIPPPPGQPPGIGKFSFFSCKYPGVGPKKRNNAPPLGRKTKQMPHHGERRTTVPLARHLDGLVIWAHIKRPYILQYWN